MFVLLLLLYCMYVCIDRVSIVFVVIVLHWAEEALVPFGMLHLNNDNNKLVVS